MDIIDALALTVGIGLLAVCAAGGVGYYIRHSSSGGS